MSTPAGQRAVGLTGTADTRMFRVLATCGVFEPGFRGGGPVRSVANIVDTVSAHTELVLVTGDRDLGATTAYPGLSGRWVSRHRSRVFYLNPKALRHWLRLWRELRSVRFDLLYVNSLWSPVYTLLPVLAVRLGMIHAAAVLIAPRGELSPGALTLKAGKKRLFLSGWSRLLRAMGVTWHATSDREATEIRVACPWAQVELCANRVTLPLEPVPVTDPGTGPARLVFISRICAKKNLRLILLALRELRQPVEFDIYGPTEDARYWSGCVALIAQLPANVRASYRGELPPAEVRATFARYDAFVFPTLGENFGHVIAESLSASCPVVCSDRTPFSEVLRNGGGTVVRELTTEAFRDRLADFAALTPAQRLRTRALAGEAYRSWRASAGSPNIIEQVRARLLAAPVTR